jgi:hypothetical protein
MHNKKLLRFLHEGGFEISSFKITASAAKVTTGGHFGDGEGLRGALQRAMILFSVRSEDQITSAEIGAPIIMGSWATTL